MTSNKFESLPQYARESDEEHTPVTSPDLVFAALERGILLGRYVPGQRLVVADLMNELKLSRGSVREGFKRLAAEGVVVQVPHRGVYIRALSRREALDLLQVLRALLGLAVGLAAARCRLDRVHKQHGHAEKLTRSYERLAALGSNSDRFLQSIERTRFYDTILEIAGNQELTRINPLLPTVIMRMQIHQFVNPEMHSHLFADYKTLYDALMAGDPLSAKRIIDRHIRYSRIQALHLPDEAFATLP